MALTPDPTARTDANCQPADLRAALAQYSLYLAARNYSVYTIEQRAVTATAFIDVLAGQGIARADEVTPELIEAYRLRLFHHRKADGAPLAVRTQSVRLVALRAFFRWLAHERMLAADPAAELELPRSERRLPATILSPGEVEHILALPNINTKG